MGIRRNTIVPPLAVLLILLLLPALYMGAYYALLKDQISLASPPAPGVPFDLMLEPVYRIDSPIVDTALEPAHRIDRALRPDYWGS